MKIRVLVIPVIFATAFALTCPAHPETISIKGHNPDEVQGKCNGVYFAPGKKGGSYGCLNDDGSGIVCGGAGAHNASTCDTFARGPKRTKLPTRAELQARSAR